MGLRTGRGVIDPRFFRHPTPSLEGDYISEVVFFDILKNNDRPTWDYDNKVWVQGPAEPLWRGMARLAPNKDWRARAREWALESTAEHAVRVQLNIKKNFLIPREQWQDAPPADISVGTIMRVISNPNDPLVEEYRFSVRNAIGATDNWHRTILADVDLGGRDG